MHSKKIRASIAGILFILLCVLAGIIYYAQDTWHHTQEEYKWQLLHSVRDVYTERDSRSNDSIKNITNALVQDVMQHYDNKPDSIPGNALISLINAHKLLCRQYFPGEDSVKRSTYQNGLDSAFTVQLVLRHFYLKDGSTHRPIPFLMNITDSLLNQQTSLRKLFHQNNNLSRSYSIGGIKISSDNFFAEYHAVITPRNLNREVFSRFYPLLIFLIFCFLTISFFSFFSIRTILQQKKLSDQKTDFINNITHEFNTPLATIAVAVKTLQSGHQPPDMQRIRSVTEVIERQNSRLQEMVNTIIPFSNEAPVPVNDLPLLPAKDEIEKILLDFNARQQHAGQVFQLISSLDIPAETAVRISPVIFATILLNILDNAVKYQRSGTPLIIQIAAHITHQHLIITISDNGIGIKKKELKYIFDKFYRIQHGDVHAIKGMGLGLYFVKKNMQAVKGKVKLESTFGKGTTFMLRFPLSKTE